MVVAQPQGDPAISEDEGYVTLKTPKASARVRLSDGAVSFLDADGKAVLTESARGAFTPETIEGQRYVTVRSEEHTSELQSLMRISYAVFCLKKKKQQKTTQIPKYKSTTH